MPPLIRTAGEEFFGGSKDLGTTAGTLKLPLPFGAGGARLIIGTPGTASTYLLPIASYTISNYGCLVGGVPQYYIVNKSVNPITLRNAIGTLVATINQDKCARVYLLQAGASGNPFGTWAAEIVDSVSSAAIPPRQFFHIKVTSSLPQELNILSHLVDFYGYNRITPADILVETMTYAYQGSSSASVPAIDTGVFPSGSRWSLYIHDGSAVIGKAGDGGYGATPTPGLTAQAGQAGGTAIRTYMDMTLINYGAILGGGGGGGGGGNASSTQGGGGGGGGAGYGAGLPGAGGGGGGQPGFVGLWVPGSGGASPVGAGGAGGYHGQGGTAGTGGAAGGAAGVAITRLTGTTVTKIVAGTITGAETTF